MRNAQKFVSRSGHVGLAAAAIAITFAGFSHVPTAHAATMCMASDTVAVILDPDIQGESNTYTSGEWNAVFSYGNVSGIATCNDTSGSYGVAYPQYNFEQETTGVNCWCRMLRPARSAWVYRTLYSSASACEAVCTNLCGSYVRNHADFRGGVFGSAGD